MQTNQQWRLKARPDGLFKESDFEWREEEVSELQEGQILVRVVYLSLDPTQRVWAKTDSYLPKVELGAVMRSNGLGYGGGVQASQVCRGRHRLGHDGLANVLRE